jgi:hypothetical protein
MIFANLSIANTLRRRDTLDRCSFCDKAYYFPAELNHTEEECFANQDEAATEATEGQTS